jgi:archaellum component FlaC
MLVKVKDSPFVRDVHSMALMNTDEQAKNDYYSKVRLMQNQKDEINKVKSEISEVKDDLKELKSMVAQLLSKGLNV